MDLEKKKELVKEQLIRPDFRIKFQKIYPFTNENINGYIKELNLSNKKVLTVGSSADQALNSYLCDTTDITVIDLNPYTKDYFYLKKAAIKELSYKEYLRFFSFEGSYFKNRKALNRKTFKKICLSIDNEESREFWKYVYNNASVDRIRENLFSKDYYDEVKVKKCNNYLENENSYNRLKYKITSLNPTIITGDIHDITLDKKYDHINLSNIADYYPIPMTKKLVDKLKNNLNEDGTILISYLYDTDINSTYEDIYCEIYNLDRTLRTFHDADLITFQGVKDLRLNTGLRKDSILVYKKK